MLRNSAPTCSVKAAVTRSTVSRTNHHYLFLKGPMSEIAPHTPPFWEPAVPLYEPIQGDRSQYWHRLRNTYGAVAPVLLEPGVPAWLLLSYDLNKQVMTDDKTFARDPRWWRDLQDGTISRESGTWAVWHKRATALLSDDAEHRYLSGALIASFAQLDEHRILGQIRQVAHNLIDEFAPYGHVDLMGQYARLLPLHVLCRIFGMSPAQITQITEQMSLIWQGHPGAMVAVEKMRGLLLDIARRARFEPDPHSLPTLLIEQGHTDVQVGDQLSLIVSAAADPVTHTIGQALRQLLSDPELAQAHAHSTLLVSEAINLVLVHNTPLETIVARHPRRDLTLGGYKVRKGDCLVFGFAAASQDLYQGRPAEQVASNRAHLMFGAGAHQCPHYGRDLALAMAETAISTLTDRLHGLRLATPPSEHRWLPTTNLHGLVDLPAHFTPLSDTTSSSPQEFAWTHTTTNPARSTSTPPGRGTTPAPKPTSSGRPVLWRRWSSLMGWRSKR